MPLTVFNLLWTAGFAVVWVAITAVVLGGFAFRARRADPTLVLECEVGGVRIHRIVVEYTQQTARVRVLVDGRQTLSENFSTWFATSRAIDLTIGDEERHTIRVLKQRRRIQGGFRPQEFTVFVDGRIAAAGTSRIPRDRSWTAGPPRG